MSMIWHLLKEFNSLSQDEQASRLPFCIAENVTLKQFHAKCDQLESGGCFRWEFKDGKAWIYELPIAVHERAAGVVISELLFSRMGLHARELLFSRMGLHARDVSSAAHPRCNNNGRSYDEPDGSLEVQGGGRPGPGHADTADKAGNRWPTCC
jgi:hypothetical protein